MANVQRSGNAGARFGDEGSIAAEFALAMPAVVLVLALVLGAVKTAGMQIQLQDAAAVTARSLARGDAPPHQRGTRLSTVMRGDLVCARLERRIALIRIPITVSASSCALSGGR